MSRFTVTLAALAIVLGGIATTSASPASADDNNHGTHVAGTFAAIGNNAIMGDGSVRFVSAGVSGAPSGVEYTLTVTDTQTGAIH